MQSLGQEDRFSDMSIEDYAAEKGAELLENPQRRNCMAGSKSKQDLRDDLDDANDYIEQLEAKLDDIIGIAGDDDSDDTDDDSDDMEEDSDD